MHYNHELFPFYEIFDELTDWTQQTGASPLETYLRFRRLRRDTRLTPCPDYASTSITSGGHARLPGLKSYEVINANTDTSRRLISEMANQGTLDARATVLPADLGYLPGWRQSDYMHLWSLIIGGPDLGIRRRNQSSLRYQRRFDKKLAKNLVDVEKMNDKTTPAEQRAPEYFQFARSFAEAIDDPSYESAPARSVIGLVDPETSLGCQTEKLLGKLLGIPLKRVAPVRKIDIYAQAIEDHKLIEDMDQIIKFGGTIVEVATGGMLIVRAV